ncbi:MAG: DUF2807 domain-containing protein [Flavobacteriaceae bacterium]|nr:DUF2807 domain-containing protein [Flavobacteriaceae bacterium]
MKNSIITLLLITSISSFSQKIITKKIEDFYKIKVYNGIRLELLQSNESKIEISGDKADKIKIKNTEGILRVSLRFPELLAGDKVNVKLFYNKDIQTIDGNEGSKIIGKGINQTHLEVKAQEGASIKLDIKTKHLKVKSVTGGVIDLTGTSKNQDIELDLYGVYHGYNLFTSNSSTVKAGTGSKAEVYAGETLFAKVSFGGSILYKGKPEVIKNKKMAGGIIKQMN